MALGNLGKFLKSKLSSFFHAHRWHEQGVHAAREHDKPLPRAWVAHLQDAKLDCSSLNVHGWHLQRHKHRPGPALASARGWNVKSCSWLAPQLVTLHARAWHAFFGSREFAPMGRSAPHFKAAVFRSAARCAVIASIFSASIAFF